MFEEYNIPNNIDELFEDLQKDGSVQYSIIDYNADSMDNIVSMSYFLEQVDIGENFIVESSGTQVVLKHPDYEKKAVIDSGGLGDFYSHGYDVTWADE